MSKKTNYQQTLDYLYQQLPMFHRIGPAAFKKDLTNTVALCGHLGRPERAFPSIHIAGTNGKGSVAHILSAILTASGLKTGLYTSPHYKDFRERIKIDGQFISKKEIVSFVELHKDFCEKLKPSFFEWTVGLAFDYFAKAAQTFSNSNFEGLKKQFERFMDENNPGGFLTKILEIALAPVKAFDEREIVQSFKSAAEILRSL